MVQVAGKVIRPAIYEMKPGETLRDVLGFAGGFDPSASEARVQINRVLPPESRGPGGRRGSSSRSAPTSSSAALFPRCRWRPATRDGAERADRQRGYVTVKGNVWVEGQVGFAPG